MMTLRQLKHELIKFNIKTNIDTINKCVLWSCNHCKEEGIINAPYSDYCSVYLILIQQLVQHKYCMKNIKCAIETCSKLAEINGRCEYHYDISNNIDNLLPIYAKYFKEKSNINKIEIVDFNKIDRIF